MQKQNCFIVSNVCGALTQSQSLFVYERGCFTFRELFSDDIQKEIQLQEMHQAISNKNSSHTSNDSPPNPHTPPVYEEIQELHAARTRHPQRRPLGEAPDLTAEYTFTQCPAYGTSH